MPLDWTNMLLMISPVSPSFGIYRHVRALRPHNHWPPSHPHVWEVMDAFEEEYPHLQITNMVRYGSDSMYRLSVMVRNK